MICRKCGRALPNDSVFCQYCGTKLVEVDGTEEKKSTDLNKLTELLKKPKVLAIVAGCVVLVLVLVLSLQGSPVSSVQKAIDGIGTVTMNSEAKIKQAEALYADLDERDKLDVENIDVLFQAREDYDEMAGAVETAADAMTAAIDAIYYENGKPCVDPKDQEAVVYARSVYTRLTEKGLGGHVSDLVNGLEAAEDGLAYVHGAKLFKEAYENSQEGMHRKAANLYRELLDSYPNYRDAEEAVKNMCYSLNVLAQDEYVKKNYEDSLRLYEETLAEDPKNDTATSGAISCTTKLMEEYFEEEDYEKAELLLDASNKKYGATRAFADYQKKLQEELEDICPENGDYVEKKLVGGRGLLKVNAGDKNVLIKIESAEDWTKYMTCYIKANDKVEISMADGVYRIKYAVGDTWYGKEHLFGEDTKYSQIDKLIEYETTYADGYFHCTERTFTMSPKEGGTMETTGIPKESF